QPWATFPTITAGDIKPNEKVKGSRSVTPAGPNNIGSYELFVDGHLVGRAPPGTPFPIDTKRLPDGYHELRFVGSKSDPVETQGRAIVPILVNNHDAAVELTLNSASRVGLGGKLKFNVRQAGATAIALRQNSATVARVQGEAGVVEIPAETLG